MEKELKRAGVKGEEAKGARSLSREGTAISTMWSRESDSICGSGEEGVMVENNLREN